MEKFGVAAGSGRGSVRIQSHETWTVGANSYLCKHWALNLSHGTAWWFVGPNWPSGGEIDVIEGVWKPIYFLLPPSYEPFFLSFDPFFSSTPSPLHTHSSIILLFPLSSTSPFIRHFLFPSTSRFWVTYTIYVRWTLKLLIRQLFTLTMVWDVVSFCELADLSLI